MLMKVSSNICFEAMSLSKLTDKNMEWDILALSELINSSPASAAYMRQWTGSALVQIMACRLFGTKPLSEPMLGCCQLDP